ncbi:putative exosome complex exonuclease RRP40 [Paratrimastix pyriformis]|uniref:Exosome complex exonuclease RRP40 n=1 Tax=Paratrimastix pyriformis TaxID=342808 RepID=A0ABQ8UJU9_9EUKA|nr:putative exosome complex exonuclease RRP40 [Paratrimastix pyriformis]
MQEPTVVLPGDVVSMVAPGLRIGAGLIQMGSQITATKAGLLRQKRHNHYVVETSQKRYIPCLEDYVVGVIRFRRGKEEEYDVDINAYTSASLPVTGFEGATRKNMAPLTPGTLVYGRVTFANKHMDPAITCMGPAGKASGFGVLRGGHYFACTTALCRSLLAPDCYLLHMLGQLIPFEIAVGINARVWVNTGSVRDTILLREAILSSEGLDPPQIDAQSCILARQFFQTKYSPSTQRHHDDLTDPPPLTSGPGLLHAPYPLYVYLNTPKTDGFDLCDLRGLDQLVNLEAIKELDLTLFAAHNRLISLNVAHLEHLVLLDLSGNQLHAIPTLVGLPHLADLNLNLNNISGALEALAPLAGSLTKLSLADNQLDFSTVANLRQALDILAGLRGLKHLDLRQNPFRARIAEERLTAMLSALPSGLKTLDGIQVTRARRVAVPPLDSDYRTSPTDVLPRAAPSPLPPSSADPPSLLGLLPDDIYRSLTDGSVRLYVTLLGLCSRSRRAVRGWPRRLTFVSEEDPLATSLWTGVGVPAPIPAGADLACLVGPCLGLEELELSPWRALERCGCGEWVPAAFENHPNLRILRIPTAAGLTDAALGRILQMIGPQLQQLVLNDATHVCSSGAGAGKEEQRTLGGPTVPRSVNCQTLAALRSCGQLRKLNMGMADPNPHAPWPFEDTLRPLTSLEELTLWRKGATLPRDAQKLLRLCPCLRTLNGRPCDVTGAESLDGLDQARCARLQELRLAWFPLRTVGQDVLATVLGMSSGTLRLLEIEQVPSTWLPGVRRALDGLPQLRSLTLGCDEDPELSTGLLDRLEELNLTRLEGTGTLTVASEGLLQLSLTTNMLAVQVRASRLRTLTLRHTRSSEPRRQLLLHCPNLRSLAETYAPFLLDRPSELTATCQMPDLTLMSSVFPLPLRQAASFLPFCSGLRAWEGALCTRPEDLVTLLGIPTLVSLRASCSWYSESDAPCIMRAGPALRYLRWGLAGQSAMVIHAPALTHLRVDLDYTPRLALDCPALRHLCLTSSASRGLRIRLSDPPEPLHVAWLAPAALRSLDLRECSRFDMSLCESLLRSPSGPCATTLNALAFACPPWVSADDLDRILGWIAGIPLLRSLSVGQALAERMVVTGPALVELTLEGEVTNVGLLLLEAPCLESLTVWGSVAQATFGGGPGGVPNSLQSIWAITTGVMVNPTLARWSIGLQ